MRTGHAQVLSIGVFFSVITLGLSARLPSQLYAGLISQGVPASTAHQVASLPPVGSLFAAFLGYNPIQQLVPATVLAHLPAGHAAFLTGRSFFPSLISPAFKTGLRYAFDFAIGCSVVAAIASLLRGGRYIHGQDEPLAPTAEAAEDAAEVTANPGPLEVGVPA